MSRAGYIAAAICVALILAALLIAAILPPLAQPLSPRRWVADLLAHWSFDDGRAITTDRAGREHHAELVGDPAYSYDIPPAIGRGRSLAFDGMDDQANATGDEDDFDLAELTVAFWFKTTDFGSRYAGLVTKGDTAWRVQRARGSDRIEFAFSRVGGGNASLSTSRDVADGEWHHYVASCNGREIVVYLDGVRDGSATVGNAVMRANNYPVVIGANAQRSGRHYAGLLDDVQVYGWALSPAAITRIARWEQIR